METLLGHLASKDLAREVGVSIATLDRVLNGRPGVREQTARHLRTAIERHCRWKNDDRGAQERPAKSVFVTPEANNRLMRTMGDCVTKMSNWLTPRRVSVEMIAADIFDPLALALTLEFLRAHCDGVAVVALDHQRVRAAIDELVSGAVHVGTLVSDVPGSTRAAQVPIL